MRSHRKSWQKALRTGLAAGILGGGLGGNSAVRADTPAIVHQTPSMDEVIEGLIAEIRTSKSLPGWAVNTAMNAYNVYKTYRNGDRVEEIGATVLAVLKEIADIKADANKGREMNLREYRLKTILTLVLWHTLR